jgi:Secretion system C-terminal sorting domain
MKKQLFYLLLLLGVASSSLRAQAVASSCEADDSLRKYYDFDATKLAIRYLTNNNATDASSIVVDSIYKAPILKALLAVHQAYQLPARDEVVDFFNIHALGAPSTNSFIVYADSSEAWVKTWLGGNPLTGLEEIDLWVDSFDLVFSRSPEMVFVPELQAHLLQVNFHSKEHLNLRPLLDQLMTVNGIVSAEEDHYVSETEKDITFEMDSLDLYADLTYRYAWGTCQDGCNNEHFWKFRVYFVDCTVELLSDGGDILNLTDPNQISQIAVFPNPATNVVTVKLIGPARSDFSLHLYDAYGRLVFLEDRDFHNGFLNLQVDFSSLPMGVYFLTFSYENQVLTERVVKEY